MGDRARDAHFSGQALEKPFFLMAMGNGNCEERQGSSRGFGSSEEHDNVSSGLSSAELTDARTKTSLGATGVVYWLSCFSF